MIHHRRPGTICLAALLVGLVAGCSRTDNEPGPGGVTVSEAKALDNAAEMLESREAGSATAADKSE